METVQIGDKTFELRGYTFESEKEFQEKAPKIEERLNNREINRFEYYHELLQLVLVPREEVAELDPYADIEGRHAEQIIMDFIPPSIQTYRALIGFLKQ